MGIRVMVAALCVTVVGCAARGPAVMSPPAPASAPAGAGEAAVSPEVQRRVDMQVAQIEAGNELISVARTKVGQDGEHGWRVTYRAIEQTFGGLRTAVKWVDMGEEGYVIGMSPPN
jgi:hypothetical protein